jgi:hypothetical protein
VKSIGRKRALGRIMFASMDLAKLRKWHGVDEIVVGKSTAIRAAGQLLDLALTTPGSRAYLLSVPATDRPARIRSCDPL